MSTSNGGPSTSASSNPQPITGLADSSGNVQLYGPGGIAIPTYIPSSVAITGGTIGGALFPLVTVANVSAAAANTTVLQAALTAGGTVFILNPGVIYTNATLIYGSDTRLILGSNTTIRQAPGTNKSLITSSAAIAKTAGGTSVTLTQGSGHSVTVTWTAHGKSVGDAVWISGATPSVYNGVFRVVSVTDANNFVVFTTYSTATAISGTITAVAAVKNFHMDGGAWDYDYANNGASNQLNAHAVLLYGLMDSSAVNVWAGNANKFAFCICGTNNFTWRALRGDNRSDLVKVYGPANGVFGYGLSGRSQDDGVSFQTKEPPAFIAYQFDYGDVWNVSARDINVSANVGGSVAVLYPSDNEVMDRVSIDGIAGFADAANSVRIDCGASFSTGVMGDIMLRNIGVSGDTDAVTVQKCSLRSLRIDSFTHNPYSQANAASYGVSISSNAVIRLLSIDGGGSSFPAVGNYAVAFVAGSVKTLNFSNFVFDCLVANGQTGVYLQTGCTVGKVNIQNCYGNTGMKYAVDVAGAPTAPVSLTLRGNKFEGSGVISVQAVTTVNVALEGNDIASASLGVIRTSANATVSIRSDGCNNIAGTLMVAAVGTPVLTVYGNDLSVDVGATGFGKTTSGQYCFNNGSARGTLAQNRLVTCSGTQWVQVDTPANVF